LYLVIFIDSQHFFVSSMMKSFVRWIDESRTCWRPFNNEFLSSFGNQS